MFPYLFLQEVPGSESAPLGLPCLQPVDLQGLVWPLLWTLRSLLLGHPSLQHQSRRESQTSGNRVCEVAAAFSQKPRDGHFLRRRGWGAPESVPTCSRCPGEQSPPSWAVWVGLGDPEGSSPLGIPGYFPWGTDTRVRKPVISSTGKVMWEEGSFQMLLSLPTRSQVPLRAVYWE